MPPNSGGLDLSPGDSYNNQVNDVFNGYTTAYRIVSQNSENSVLWDKKNSTFMFCKQMPAGGTLNAKIYFNLNRCIMCDIEFDFRRTEVCGTERDLVWTVSLESNRRRPAVGLRD
jgi:hypothetical protein